MYIVEIDDLIEYASIKPDVQLAHSDNESKSLNLREVERLVSYYSNKGTCAYALQQLIEGVSFIENGDNNFLCKWVNDYKALGTETLLMFSIEFLDHYKSDESGCLYLPLSDIYIERNAFNSIIYFDSIFRILHWEMEIGIRDINQSNQLELDYYRVDINKDPLKRVLIYLSNYLSNASSIA